MLTASMDITLGGSLLVLILSLIIAVGAALLFYRYTLPPLPARLKIILSSLRSLSLVLIILILFEPVLRFVNHNEQTPVVAVLIDDSQSMTIKEGTENRAEAVKRFLKGKYLGNVSPDIKIHYYAASSKLNEHYTTLPDSLMFKGETTDLSNVFSELKEQMQRDNIQSVVLITDGEYNIGKNPLYEAEALGIPVYTIGVGDTSEQKDILVKKIITNNLAYAGTRVPVDVAVKTSGYNNANVEVILSENETTIDRKVVQVTGGTHEYPVRLFLDSKEEGTKKYTVSVSKLPEELTDRNNARTFFLKVLRSKIKALLIAGAPSPDVSSVRQALVEEEHFSVQSLVQKDGNGFYEGGFTSSTADSVDCFVFVGFPSMMTDEGIIRRLQEIVEQKKIPVLFVNSKTISYDKLRTFESILPFTWTNTSTDEIFVFPSVAEKQKTHPLVTLEGNMTPEIWHQLPPIYKTQTLFKIKPEADIIAAVKMQNVVLSEPLVAIRTINRQKSFAITGYGIWRWRLLAHSNPETEKFLPFLISNAVRWLTTKEDEKNVRVVPVKETFTTAEPIEFTGQVYDEQLKPVSDAEVTVELVHGSEKIPLVLRAIGDGRYEGSLDGAGEGDYLFTAKASGDGRMIGVDKGRFSVGQMNVEFLETKMNKSLLEQIAYRTGGKYYDIGKVDVLGADIGRDVKFTPKEIVRTSEIELWNWKYIAAIIVLLLGIEWFLRKRSGML